jgi:hypothetical protein
MRDRSVRTILSVLAWGILAAACGDDSGSSGGRGGTAGASTGTGGGGTGGSGGASAGGSGGSAATGGSGGATGGTGGASGGSGGATGGSGGSAGAGGATGGKAGSSGTAGKGGSGGSGGSGGITDAGVSDARGDVTDARVPDVSDTGTVADVSRPDVSSPDGAAGDGGSSPYKGVANSACNDMITLGSTWFYNWTLSRGNCNAPQFVPMLWGHTGNEQTATGIANALNTLVSQGQTTVLGFNEPDTATQSNITVANAIALWPSFNNPALRIGSPATSANANGQTWFKDFMAQVNADTTGTLRVDFIAIHWYGWNAGSCDANASQLESYIKTMEAIPGNRPIWITEWGCMNQSNPDDATVVNFFNGAVAMFAKHPRIERYAWYPWNPHNELIVDGGLSAMGTAFAAAPPYK